MYKVVEKRGHFLFLQEINKYNYHGKSLILNLQSISCVQENITRDNYKCLAIGHINIDMTDMNIFYDMITGPDRIFILTVDYKYESQKYNLVDNFPTNESDLVDILLDKYRGHQLLEYFDEILEIVNNLIEINCSKNDYKKKISNNISQIITKSKHQSKEELRKYVMNNLFGPLLQNYRQPMGSDIKYDINEVLKYLNNI